MNKTLAIFLAFAVTSCEKEAEAEPTGMLGDPCGPTTGGGCMDPLVCVDGRCREPCISDQDCPLQHACTDGACLPTADPCLNDCENLPNVAGATCDRNAVPPACVITACDGGWIDVDGVPENGC